MQFRRWLTMGTLVLAGESIYMLPYMRRTFQTSLRALIDISNTQLGLLNSMFGLLALVCYLPGGWIADRVSPRRLLTGSLLATGLGGLYMASFPPYGPLLVLHAFWGVVSILTFWAALIKATRDWGGEHEQGLAFGLLDGGRGLVGALLASGATWLFSRFRSAARGLRAAVLLYSAAPMAAATGVWLLIPEQLSEPAAAPNRLRANQIKTVVRMPVVWLMALVILTAYTAYVGTFDFAAFAEEGFGQSSLFGAQMGTFRDWLRPLACLGAGLIADRLSPSAAVSGCFAWLVGGCALTALGPAGPEHLWLLWIEVVLVSVPAFALRGIYYALLQEGRVPEAVTGTAVGLVSVVGYTPDIFAPPLSGWLVDTVPGAGGFQRYFGIIGGTALLGLLATLLIRRRGKQISTTA